jgi:hypothetical protein
MSSHWRRRRAAAARSRSSRASRRASAPSATKTPEMDVRREWGAEETEKARSRVQTCLWRLTTSGCRQRSNAKETTLTRKRITRRSSFVRQKSSATARQETGRGTGSSLNPTYLEVAVRGRDVERGEPVEERGAAEQRGAGAERGGEAGNVAGLHGSKEVHLLAGAAAADAVAHRRQPAGSSGERRLGTGCLVSCGVEWSRTGNGACRAYSSPTLILPAHIPPVEVWGGRKLS